MSLQERWQAGSPMLMEGALGERLKREYGLTPHPTVALADMVYREDGRAALATLWRGYAAVAKKYHLPFLATTPTRRANRERLADTPFRDTCIRDSVRFLRQCQESWQLENSYIGGLMGCRGDAYTGEGALTEDEAAEFHAWAVAQFREAGVDFLYAGILPTLPEAAGLAKAMAKSGLPYIISFTIQRSGCLIDGMPIADAIRYIDGCVTAKPLCYMTNCVHPMILWEALHQPCNDVPLVKERFRGIQANTSPLSYDKLDHATELLTATPKELANDMARLQKLGHIQIFGGCCGTDEAHMEAIAQAICAST